MSNSGDIYKRKKVSQNLMQCGCRWVATQRGDQLLECVFHRQATVARVRKFDRERGAPCPANHR